MGVRVCIGEGKPGVTAAAIGIDVGTSGARAAVVDAGGAPLGFGSARLALEDRRNPESWWRAVESALAALKASAALSGVRCIAVDGPSGTLLLLNDAGQPMRQASLYNDAAPEEAVRAVAAAAPAGSAAGGPARPWPSCWRCRACPARRGFPTRPTGLQLNWAHPLASATKTTR